MRYEVLVEVQFFSCGCPTAPVPFVEKALSLIKLLLHLGQKLLGHICVGLFLGSLFCSTGLYLPLLQYESLDSCSYEGLEIR